MLAGGDGAGAAEGGACRHAGPGEEFAFKAFTGALNKGFRV